uniref:Peptidase A2 domain-containing protein n=1 Tax=Romanomermis culicivorax TaxID=13658 RepID=A0A915JG61_ROMCU
MIGTMKNDNQGHVLKITNTMSGNKAPILNPNHVIVTITALIGQHPRPTQYQSTGLWCQAHKSRTHNTQDCLCLKCQHAQQNNHQDFRRQSHAAQPSPTDFRTNSTISAASPIGDPAMEYCPKEVPTIPTAHEIIFTKASLQSSELPLKLLALPSTSTASATNSDMRTLNQSTLARNMVIPSKKIATTTPIISPGIVCWNVTTHASKDPCHIRSSFCQIDNLTPSTKMFVRQYASMRAFQIPIRIGAVKAHALIDTSAQCSVLSSGLIKRMFDKQSLQLPICGKIKVANGAIVNAHGPVVVTMESAFGEHMIKCVILDDDNNDQCIIVIASVHPHTELFLNAANDNVLEEIPEAERVSFSDDKSDTFSHTEEIEAAQAVQHPQPSPHQPPSRQLEVTELAEPIFLVAQASVSILPHCQQWVTSTIFPMSTTTIPDVPEQAMTLNFCPPSSLNWRWYSLDQQFAVRTK